MARLLEHKPLNGTHWTPLNRSTDYMSFNLEFKKYFTDEEHHQIHHPANAGDLAAICMQTSFYRCKVVEVIESKSGPTILPKAQISIHLIDVGRTTKCNEYDLFHLPKKFCDFPAQAVDVIIAGIVPMDYDHGWDSTAKKNVERWLSIDKAQHKCIKANVLMSVMNEIWVDSLFLVQKLPKISCEVTVISMKLSLIDNKLAIEDSAGFEAVKMLAKETGI